MCDNKNNKLETKEKIEIAIEAGIQLIPYVGSSIATAYFGTKHLKQFKRIESFYQNLNNELNNIKESIVKIDSQYIDGLVSLIEKVNNCVENEHSNKKIEYLKKYMINLLKDPVTILNYDIRKVYLDILNNMTELECEIIIFIYQQKTQIEVGSITKPGIDQYAIVGAISRLKSFGFFRTSQASFSIGGNSDNTLNELVSINDYGLNFVNFCLNNI